MMKKFFAWLTPAVMAATLYAPQEAKIEKVNSDPVYTQTHLDSIFLIQCKASPLSMTIDGSGTGFLINNRTVVTAQHVVEDMYSCTIDGVALKMDQENKTLDYATLSIGTRGLESLPIRCEGFKRGENYYAIGYARGSRFTMNRLIASSRFENATDENGQRIGTHLRELRGTAIPGMSGGPILDKDGYVVGITVAISTSGVDRVFSRELKETHLCQV